MNPVFLQAVTEPADSVAVETAKSALEEISMLSFDDLLSKLVNGMVDFAIHVAIALIVFYVGKLIINKIHKFVGAVMLRRQVDKSLMTFTLSLIKIVMLFILLVIVIGILGIETSSFLAIFASAGVAIGMALSGTLQNFAGGVLILLLKPYKIGDVIEAQGYSGTVTEIQIFHTVICTADNKSIIIPNGGLSTGSINNASKEDYRRVDWTVSIAYGDDVDKARQLILDMLRSDDRVVKQYIEDDRESRAETTEKTPEVEPVVETESPARRSSLCRLFRRRSRLKEAVEDWKSRKETELQAMLPKIDRAPVVYVACLNSSSVDLSVRAWTQSKYYWGLYFDFNERVYKELPKHGLSFPFPQMDVHLSQSPQA